MILNLLFAIGAAALGQAPAAPQTVTLDGTAGGDRFEGIGAVSGGGATSVLLKDYPAKPRSEVLDLLFKPKFGASISSLYVEVPGDGNSTQGTEPSHMHTRNDEDDFRGYEWWLMKEAKRRDPDLALDACAWGAPAWVGNGEFWSQDMADYYVKWIKALKSVHGLDLDAVGCRNEKGVSEPFVKLFKRTLVANGLGKVKLHAFDNWGDAKWDWVKDLQTDPELAAAVDAIGNHTMTEVHTPPEVKAIAKALGKPIWNSEEHIYKDGFDAEISIVQAFNQNYVRDAVTKVTNWYLVGSVYPTEPYPEQPAMMVADTPWSGAYRVRPALWGYAHYGQFCKVGWTYLHGGCGNLDGGGSFVTLKSPGRDFSVVAETKGAKAAQTLTLKLAGGLSTGALCVWRSDATAQFVRQADVRPESGTVTLTLEPNAIYSLSTTTGQQKGAFEPAAPKAFPFPYLETFDHYGKAKSWGYLPHYTADIVGVFELAPRPDGGGTCLRQVVSQKAQSWAPEWAPYTILGDPKWKDYEASADVNLVEGGWAGILGRITNAGNGWNNAPRGYYLRIDKDGNVALRTSTQAGNNAPGDLLADGTVAGFDPKAWHNLKIRFAGGHLVGYVDGKEIVSADSDFSPGGMVGLMTGGFGNARNAALFDNVMVGALDGPKPAPTAFPQDASPLYP